MTVVSVQPKRSRLRVVIHQVHYQNLLLLRSPSAPFFTLVIPMMLLVTLDFVYGSRALPSRPDISFPQFYLSGMMTFAAVNAAYINIINGTTLARQSGMLKRIRSTPLPGWVYLAGRAASASLVALCSIVLVVVVSVVFFDAQLPIAPLPGTIVTLAFAIVCFSCVGFALTPLVSTAEAALPIAYGTFLPLAFVSDVFFPSDTSPHWLRQLASTFPVRPVARALAANTEPHATGAGFHWTELGTLAAWTMGAVVLLRFFQWDPARPRSRRHRARPRAEPTQP